MFTVMAPTEANVNGMYNILKIFISYFLLQSVIKIYEYFSFVYIFMTILRKSNKISETHNIQGVFFSLVLP